MKTGTASRVEPICLVLFVLALLPASNAQAKDAAIFSAGEGAGVASRRLGRTASA